MVEVMTHLMGVMQVLLMLCFAGIGTWRFGGFREDFADFEASCQTLFQMTFGEFPDDWWVVPPTDLLATQCGHAYSQDLSP